MEIYILSILLGLVVGSFLNVVIYRTEKEEGFGGRSYCPNCKEKIPWFDNVPLLSYLLLRGQCRFCHKKISLQYPLVEGITALTFLGGAYLTVNNLINDWLGHYFSIAGLMTISAKIGVAPSLLLFDTDLKFFELVFLWLVASVLVAILVYDFKYMLIPNSFTLAGITIVLIYNILVDALLLAAAATPKSALFIVETAGLAKKYQPAPNLHGLGLAGFPPMNLSSFFGWEPSSFYPSIIHFREYWPALITGSHTGSGLIAGLAAAAVFFLIVYLSKEAWMGMGDVKLVFFLGFLLGVFKTAVALFLAFELGAALGIILVLFGRAKMKTALPFGPFLIAGALLSLLVI